MLINVDFRYPAGYPALSDALRHGITAVRCISLPENETAASGFLAVGIRVIAVFTGESNDAGLYVMRACSALQIGNEPWYAMQGDASWPKGSADDMVNVWNHVANVSVPAVHGSDFPLVGPGIWSQDYLKWREIAQRLPRLSAAAVHVYPGASGHSLTQVKSYLSKYRAVRPDLPLIATEWTARQPVVLATARAIDTYCDQRYWFAWGAGVPGHELHGTPELGVLALAR